MPHAQTNRLIISPALHLCNAVHKKQASRLLGNLKIAHDNSIIANHPESRRFRSTSVSLFARWAQRNLSYWQ